MLTEFLIYLIVFASVAGYWSIDHRAFAHAGHCDANLIVLSLINLRIVTVCSVTAKIVGKQPPVWSERLGDLELRRRSSPFAFNCS